MHGLPFICRYAHDPLLARVTTVMTCHNLAYHGWVPRERAWSLDLPSSIGDDAGVDLLREAVRHADLVNTVSPTYALESLTRLVPAPVLAGPERPEAPR